MKIYAKRPIVHGKGVAREGQEIEVQDGRAKELIARGYASEEAPTPAKGKAAAAAKATATKKA